MGCALGADDRGQIPAVLLSGCVAMGHTACLSVLPEYISALVSIYFRDQWS